MRLHCLEYSDGSCHCLFSTQPPFYSRNKTDMYDNTLNKPLTYRTSVSASAEAKDILEKVQNWFTFGWLWTACDKRSCGKTADSWTSAPCLSLFPPPLLIASRDKHVCKTVTIRSHKSKKSAYNYANKIRQAAIGYSIYVCHRGLVSLGEAGAIRRPSSASVTTQSLHSTVRCGR